MPGVFLGHKEIPGICLGFSWCPGQKSRREFKKFLEFLWISGGLLLYMIYNTCTKILSPLGKSWCPGICLVKTWCPGISLGKTWCTSFPPWCFPGEQPPAKATGINPKDSFPPGKRQGDCQANACTFPGYQLFTMAVSLVNAW